MKKIILFSIAFLICSPHLAFSQQTVSLSTYYPAPFGSYDRLRLVPRPTIANPCKVGTLYTDEPMGNILRYCAEAGNPVPNTGDWGPMSGLWENDGADNIFLVGTDDPTTFNVGINNSTPLAVLEVSGDGLATDLLHLSFDDGNDGDIFTVTSAGNVGIGDTTPNDRIDLGTSTGNIRIYDGNNTAHVLGDQGSGEADGIVLRALGNPAAGEPIFVVESSGFSQRLRVEHDGALKTSNFLEVDGVGNSYIVGDVTIGNTAAADPPGTPEELNVYGSINLRDDDANWGKLMVDFNSGNYYAVYAP